MVTASAAESTKPPDSLTETNLGDDFDVFIRKPQPGGTADVEDGVLETGGVAAGEKRLRVGGASLAAQLRGQGQIQFKQPVLAADVTVTAADCCNFAGI